MKNKAKLVIFLVFFSVMLLPSALFANEVTGLWKTIDDETGLPKGVIAVYDYEGKLYGQIIATFDETGQKMEDDMYRQIYTSPFLKGDPPFSGMTIIWDMRKSGKKWTGGKILDPGDDEKKPGFYDCQLWKEGEDLIVRGQILFFGRNQTWHRIDDSEFPEGFKIPDWKNFKPVIPEKK